MQEYHSDIADIDESKCVNEIRPVDYAPLINPDWVTISTLCHQTARMALPDPYSGIRTEDDHKAVTDVCLRLGYPVYTVTEQTHIRYSDEKAFVCTPVQVHSRMTPEKPMVRIESGSVIAGKFYLRAALVSEAVFLKWCDDALQYDIFNYIVFTPDIFKPARTAESTPLKQIIRQLLNDEKGTGHPMIAALMMTRWYQMAGSDTFTSLFPGEWSTGQIIQLQGLLTHPDIKSCTAIATVRNEFACLADEIEHHSAGKDCMNFIAYSFLRMLLSDSPLSICHITGNMPPEFRQNFDRILFIRD